MNILTQATAAVAALGADLIEGEEQARTDYNRFMVAYGFTGSTAAGDCIVELRVNGKTVETIQNTATGVAITRDHILPCRVFVKKNALVEAIVTDAAATNPVELLIEFVP